jgi:hypothetical protein
MDFSQLYAPNPAMDGGAGFVEDVADQACWGFAPMICTRHYRNQFESSLIAKKPSE